MCINRRIIDIQFGIEFLKACHSEFDIVSNSFLCDMLKPLVFT